MLKKGIKLALSAIEHDNAGNHSKAIELYHQCLQHMHAAVADMPEGTQRASVVDKMGEYTTRLCQLKALHHASLATAADKAGDLSHAEQHYRTALEAFISLRTVKTPGALAFIKDNRSTMEAYMKRAEELQRGSAASVVVVKGGKEHKKEERREELSRYQHTATPVASMFPDVPKETQKRPSSSAHLPPDDASSVYGFFGIEGATSPPLVTKDQEEEGWMTSASTLPRLLQEGRQQLRASAQQVLVPMEEVQENPGGGGTLENMGKEENGEAHENEKQEEEDVPPPLPRDWEGDGGETWGDGSEVTNSTRSRPSKAEAGHKGKKKGKIGLLAGLKKRESAPPGARQRRKKEGHQQQQQKQDKRTGSKKGTGKKEPAKGKRGKSKRKKKNNKEKKKHRQGQNYEERAPEDGMKGKSAHKDKGNTQGGRNVGQGDDHLSMYKVAQRNGPPSLPTGPRVKDHDESHSQSQGTPLSKNTKFIPRGGKVLYGANNQVGTAQSSSLMEMHLFNPIGESSGAGATSYCSTLPGVVGDGGGPEDVAALMEAAGPRFPGMKSFSKNRTLEAVEELRAERQHKDGGGGTPSSKGLLGARPWEQECSGAEDCDQLLSLKEKLISPEDKGQSTKRRAENKAPRQAESVQALPATARSDHLVPLSQFKGDFDYEDFEFLEEVGFGSFGAVYRAKYFGTVMAVKELFHSEIEQMQRLIAREVDTLKSLRHPNIVNYMGLCVHESGLYLVTEFVEGGDLRRYLKDRKAAPAISWEWRTRVALNICSAVAFIHKKKLIHRDLKSKNVLLDGGRAKLCDFGFAREAAPDQVRMMTVKVGTHLWMAPEVVLGGEYNSQADMFSFGAVLFELLTREKPPQRDASMLFKFERKDFIAAIRKHNEHKDSQPPEHLIVLAADCTATDPNKRPSAKEALSRLEA